MCSINGFTFESESLVRGMNQATKHRGPDGTDVFVGNGISFGHNRLKIIDLSDSASQPMKSNDKRFIIIFNGEIYNYRELKKELKGSYKFRTESDTEVILAAYRKWGKDCVLKFNGIFAFAIFDKEQEELFLARDHVGVKPLYYYHNGDTLIFSSEIKAILEHDVPRVLNRNAFNIYMRILYVPEPMTMFKDISKLPPASFAIYKNGKLNIHKYWDPEPTPTDLSWDEQKRALRRVLSTSVQRQLVSDRPLGVYLSGGFDSTAVLSEMSRLHSKIDTFSVGFDLREGEEREKFNADFELARKTAKTYNTNHHEVFVGHEDVLELIEKVIWHTDEPISNPTSIAQMKLASFAKEKVAVVLGGDGGDELFGGYERYRLSRAASLYQKWAPGGVRTLFGLHSRLLKLNTPPGIDRFTLFMFQEEDLISEVLKENIIDRNGPMAFFKEHYFSDVAELFEQQFMDVDRNSWLVDQSLMLTDKMSMSAGLEQRVPLLDRELIAFSQTVPIDSKVTPFSTKRILKEALRNDIPGYLFNQPKRGWFAPGAKWLRYKEIADFAREVLLPDYYDETIDLFKWDAVGKMLDDHVEKRRYNVTILWAIMTFQLWAKKFNVHL